MTEITLRQIQVANAPIAGSGHQGSVFVEEGGGINARVLSTTEGGTLNFKEGGLNGLPSFSKGMRGAGE